jgi:hypothetical protein
LLIRRHLEEWRHWPEVRFWEIKAGASLGPAARNKKGDMGGENEKRCSVLPASRPNAPESADILLVQQAFLAEAGQRVAGEKKFVKTSYTNKQ